MKKDGNRNEIVLSPVVESVDNGQHSMQSSGLPSDVHSFLGTVVAANQCHFEAFSSKFQKIQV